MEEPSEHRLKKTEETFGDTLGRYQGYTVYRCPNCGATFQVHQVFQIIPREQEETEDFTSTPVSEDEILDAVQRVEDSDRDVLIRLCWNLRLNPEIARYTTSEAKKQHAQSVVEEIGVDRVESVLDEAFPEKNISAYDLLTALLDADLERLQGGEKAE